MLQRRCFSSTPAAFAKRRQIAIQRKKANIARQEVLKAEREPANFDPILGAQTSFTRSLLKPQTVWTADSKIQDSLYFPKPLLTQIQAAVGEAFLARDQAEYANDDLHASRPRQGVDPALPRDSLARGSLSTKYALSEAKVRENEMQGILSSNEHNSEASSRIVSLQNSNARTLRAYNTSLAIKEFQRKEGDTGSPEVQAAILTSRIIAEATHIANNKKDVHGFRGFRGLVHQRQKVLKYLRNKSVQRYLDCLERLGLSDQAIVKEITM